MRLRIGILALQGDVQEHHKAVLKAVENLSIDAQVLLIRTSEELDGLDALVMPGGESTTLSLLLEKEKMFEKIDKIPFLFGTCAGLIMLSKDVEGLVEGQKTLGLLDVTVSRNAYGRQVDSFSSSLDSSILDDEEVMFIRAPKIKRVGEKVEILARYKNEPVIVEQREEDQYLLGATCHPEMCTTRVHEYFLRKVLESTGKQP